MKNNSTPSEGWVNHETRYYELIDEMNNELSEEAPMLLNKKQEEKISTFIFQEIATAKHQERQEFVKKLFDNIVFSKDQARRIKELEENK